jgi:ATP-binding cassette subfamily C protein CydC
MVETMAGLEDLQAFGTSHSQMEKINAVNKKVNQAQLQTAMLGGVNNGLVLIAMNLTVLALIWYSIPLIQTEFLTGISLAVIVLVAMASFEATQVLPAAAQRLTESASSAGRLFQIADQSAADKAGLFHIISTVSTNLRLVDVNFQRSGESDFSLEHISLSLDKGKKIAIVGPSGGGKSSLVELILKFNVPDSGSIFLNEGDIQSLDNESVRSQFAVLAQDAYLFNCSLRENLLFAKPTASENEISSVLARVGLADWLSALPHGLDTWLGDRGTMVSGGELQRIMIARLLLQDRPFMILDEPMVNLDAPIRRELIKVLLTDFPQAGLLWISHEYSLMKLMDEILYLEDGAIIERGDHDSLLAMNGKYAEVFCLQMNAKILQFEE